MTIRDVHICPSCHQRILPARDGESTRFPTTEERLREAEQLLLEAGLMMAEADARAQAAKTRFDVALRVLEAVAGISATDIEAVATSSDPLVALVRLCGDKPVRVPCRTDTRRSR